MVPEWIVGLTAIAAFLCGIIVKIIVSVRSDAKGDSLLRMWAKSGSLGCLAMLSIWAAYFAIGWMIRQG
jgi:hypothetical protein